MTVEYTVVLIVAARYDVFMPPPTPGGGGIMFSGRMSVRCPPVVC